MLEEHLAIETHNWRQHAKCINFKFLREICFHPQTETKAIEEKRSGYNRLSYSRRSTQSSMTPNKPWNGGEWASEAASKWEYGWQIDEWRGVGGRRRCEWRILRWNSVASFCVHPVSCFNATPDASRGVGIFVETKQPSESLASMLLWWRTPEKVRHGSCWRTFEGIWTIPGKVHKSMKSMPYTFFQIHGTYIA